MQLLRKQLENVQKAIEAIEIRGQEYTIDVNGNKRALTRADLKALYQREQYLLRLIRRQQGNDIKWGVPL